MRRHMAQQLPMVWRLRLGAKKPAKGKWANKMERGWVSCWFGERKKPKNGLLWMSVHLTVHHNGVDTEKNNSQQTYLFRVKSSDFDRSHLSKVHTACGFVKSLQSWGEWKLGWLIECLTVVTEWLIETFCWSMAGWSAVTSTVAFVYKCFCSYTLNFKHTENGYCLHG